MLTGGKNLRVSYKCPKPVFVDGVKVTVYKPSVATEIVKQLVQVCAA